MIDTIKAKTSNLMLVLALVLAAMAVIAGGSVYAAKKDGDTRPGWGHGDKNHTHTGPPGQSTRP